MKGLCLQITMYCFIQNLCFSNVIIQQQEAAVLFLHGIQICHLRCVLKVLYVLAWKSLSSGMQSSISWFDLK